MSFKRLLPSTIRLSLPNLTLTRYFSTKQMSLTHTIMAEGEESKFDSFLADAIKNASASGQSCIYFLMTAGRKPDGEYWCPDCTNGNPYVFNTLKNKNATVLESCLRREDWKGNPNHPYRSNVLLGERLPTLYKIDLEGKVVDKLVETDLQNKEALAKLLDVDISEITFQ